MKNLLKTIKSNRASSLQMYHVVGSEDRQDIAERYARLNVETMANRRKSRIVRCWAKN